MQTWLIDTGPLVAFFDRGDVSHHHAKECINAFQGRLCTTSAVICEAMHFIPKVRDGPMKLSEFISAANLEIFECTGAAQFHSAVKLMDRYRDTPMDFADATLVLLAEDIAVHDVLTLDRRGFRTYRTSKGKAFRLVLDD